MANSLANVPPPSSPAPSPPRVREEEAPTAGTEIHSVSAPPRKRGSMLSAGEGTSEDRAKRPNVEPPAAPAPAPASPEPPVSERTCYSCEIAFDTMTSFVIHMQSHQEVASYVPDWDQDRDSDWSPRSPPFEPVTSPGENSSDLSADDESAAAAAAAPMEPVYLLPDLNLPAPEEEDEEEEEEEEDDYDDDDEE
ncbi:hypothetical protein RDI58_004265 [Solanum bulbocastanum]|uniref:C2H2-type domain-containing protein n=1 Tax=Solanum bulbocastanum TaxID=147425 RepID=A0AAN8U1B6_SOLBU